MKRTGKGESEFEKSPVGGSCLESRGLVSTVFGADASAATLFNVLPEVCWAYRERLDEYCEVVDECLNDNKNLTQLKLWWHPIALCFFTNVNLGPS